MNGATVHDSTTLLGYIDPEATKDPGISVIICCHNSRRVLPQTLASLSQQVVSVGLPWEVILVDNGSTDGTGELARTLWPQDAAVPIRVVEEPRLGLAHARARGVTSARYEYLAFVDDDNWLEFSWIQTAFELLRDREDVAAVGGTITPEFEAARPHWFDAVANLYAIGPLTPLSGDVTEVHVPCGAGLCLRHAALLDAQRKGFRSISVGRRGTSLAAGEDVELIYCLRLSGWRIWLDPGLRLRHFLPIHRLNWAYARKLAYWSAHATAERDALLYACKPPRRGLTNYVRRLRESWAWQVVATAGRLLNEPYGIVKSALRIDVDGDCHVLRVEYLRGRLVGLLAARRWYGRRVHEVRTVMRRLSSSTPVRASRRHSIGGQVSNA